MVDDNVSREVSRILRQKRVDVNELLPLVHGQLRAIAARQMARERSDHTLQITALVNEAYLKLVDQESLDWKTKAHFYAAAAGAMRCILVDHARGKGRAKRGGGRFQLPLDVVELAARDDITEILSVDEAIRHLEERDPRMGEVVKLRFFAGLSLQEIAQALGVTERTVGRDWTLARAFLQRQLGH